jgi:hypothetical protein
VAEAEWGGGGGRKERENRAAQLNVGIVFRRLQIAITKDFKVSCYAMLLKEAISYKMCPNLFL